MNQLELPITGSFTQWQLMLERLVQSQGAWVPMPVLARVAGSLNVHSVISTLRKKHGKVIEQKSERRPGERTVFSSYRLIQ